ncbi:hypothetical protein GIB67_014724 [Kingdonia uniflora]|uniref:UBC core domain-containing protein n=1 Tax=Kingdonia uniflora TaxID=39325 RepID=A0A7J7NUM5_9MAGN|nr:hypothetical protein GIB67_014724 [Kingdonia uniflora]
MDETRPENISIDLLLKSSNKATCEIEVIEDAVEEKFRMFKPFNIVRDPSDHHYVETKSSTLPGNWLEEECSLVNRMVEEWKILREKLPNTICVRAYRDCIDLMRVVIVGLDNTPYRDGLFFFDLHISHEYPISPPIVHHHSHGFYLGINFSRRINNQWVPGKSNILQLLVYIQAFVLNEAPCRSIIDPILPYEKPRTPGFNKYTFKLCCKSMLYTLKNPPKHFEDFVIGHFRKRAIPILLTYEECVYGDATVDTFLWIY